MTTKEKIAAIIKLRNEEKLTVSQIAQRLNISNATVYNLNSKYQIFCGKILKEYPKEKIERVIELYPKLLSTRKVATEVGLTQWEIMDILRKNNIPRGPSGYYRKKKREYSLDETLFEKIDTEEKAYILGLLYSDGNVATKKPTISISLHENDRYMLEKVQKIFKTDRPIRKIKNSSCCVFTIHSEKIKTDLIKLGCIPAKSLVLKFPTEEQVPKHLMHHCIRGITDGDGCISKITGRKTYKISICGSNDCIKELQNYLIKTYNTSPGSLYRHRNISVLGFAGIEDVKKIYHTFYDDATIYLERKKVRFDEFMQATKDMLPKRQEINGIMYKRCYICHEYKTLDNFRARSRNIDGKDDCCKICKNKEDKEQYQKRKLKINVNRREPEYHI